MPTNVEYQHYKDKIRHSDDGASAQMFRQLDNTCHTRFCLVPFRKKLSQLIYCNIYIYMENVEIF